MTHDYTSQEAIGESENFFVFQQALARVARVDRPVLLIGERGSGKELAAARLHFLSERWNAPFVALNCAALPPGLIESELFGHEAGSFTGATARRRGRFEEADGGTLLLDEIGLIPLEVQEKILRAVEYGSFQRVGSSQSIDVNVRIIGATNQNLPALCESGLFKQDLLDRLSFEVLFIPPLRERGDDLIILARHFARRMSRELGRRRPIELADSALAQIRAHPWPGNIRELKNAVERAVYREDGATVTSITLNPFHNPWSDAPADQLTAAENQSPAVAVPPEAAENIFDAYGSAANPPSATGLPIDFQEEVRMLEERRLNQALSESDGHQGKAAELLGLSYNQFRGLYRKYLAKS